MEDGRITQDKEFKKRIIEYRKKHNIAIDDDDDLLENESKAVPPQQKDVFMSEKSQSELTEKIKAPPANDENLGLTKNQRRNLKKKKLKKKKQAAKKAQIEIEQHIQDDESDGQNEDVKVIEKPENLNLDEAFNNQEKDHAKDATKIHFDK